MDLSIVNVIEVSVSAAPVGLGEYNTSNIALFSADPYAVSFGADPFKIYESSQDVGIDFGTDSQTFAMAESIFAQTPNILQGNGYLVIIPFIPDTQTITPSAVPASGSVVLHYGAGVTAAINWNDTAVMIQAKLRAIPALAGVSVTGTLATAVVVKMSGVYGPSLLMTDSADTLEDSGSAPVTLAIVSNDLGETLVAALTRSVGLVQFFAILTSIVIDQVDMLAAAAFVQGISKMIGFVSKDPASVEIGGQLDLLRSGSLDHSRGLFYGAGDDASALGFAASYFGRAFSTNFDGSNTTQNMNLKDLATVQPDPSMTETLKNKCKAAGADIYASIQGVPKVLSFGANSFFDQVYNRLWLVGALEVAGFNYLAEASTKIPQTEGGMDGFKGAYRVVCEQAVTNQYAAPGKWNSSTTFGNQQDFLLNISQRGYYIYSQPIAQQQQAQRAARVAPLVQIALKEAGAINSGVVIVNINP